MSTPERKTDHIAKLVITCGDDHECTVKFSGDRRVMLAAFAGLLENESEDNIVHHLMVGAMSLVNIVKMEKEEEKKNNEK